MNRMALAALAAAITAASAGSGAAAQTVDPGREQANLASVARGRDLVKDNCGGCHAIGVQGASPLDAAPPFRDLGERYPAGTLAQALEDGLLSGHPAMPKFRFLAAEVKDIIAYLTFVQQQRGATASLGDGPRRY